MRWVAVVVHDLSLAQAFTLKEASESNAPRAPGVNARLEKDSLRSTLSFINSNQVIMPRTFSQDEDAAVNKVREQQRLSNVIGAPIVYRDPATLDQTLGFSLRRRESRKHQR